MVYPEIREVIEIIHFFIILDVSHNSRSISHQFRSTLFIRLTALGAY